MKRLALSIALNTTADGAAPASVELIPAGPQVRGRDGRGWLFDAASADLVISAYAARGIDLPIDWEHATQYRAPNGEAAPAAAWIGALEIRDGALWGTVTWTPRGAEQVANREYRFLSPVFDFDPATGRIHRLVSAGLTNLPNLQLQALNAQEDHAMNRSALLAAAIVASLGLTDTADDDAVATAINAMKKDLGLAQATNAEKVPPLDRYVPRADYDALATRATNAEEALKTQRAAEHTAAVDTAINAALSAGKITPATEGYHRASCADADGLARFAAFVTAAPAVGVDSNLDGKTPGTQATALNAEEIAVCAATGIDPKDFLAAKAA